MKWIIEWFFRNIIFDGLQTEKYGTEKMFENEEMRTGINDSLKRLNRNFMDRESSGSIKALQLGDQLYQR